MVMQIPELTSEEADALLRPYFPLFVKAFEEAWKEYHSDHAISPAVRAKLPPGTRAAVVHALMVHQAEAEFRGVAGVNVSRKFGYQFLDFGKASIRLKKLDHHDRPRNIRTDRVKKLNSTAIMDGLSPEAQRLVLGYQTAKQDGSLVALKIVAPNGRRVAFRLTIKDYTGQGNFFAEITRDITPKDGGQAPRVFAKGEKRDEEKKKEGE